MLNIVKTAYAGEVLNVFIVAAITKNTSMLAGIMNVIMNIKKQISVPTLDVSDFIQPRVENPDRELHTGTITVDERYLKPKDMMFMLSFLPAKFENHWKATELGKYILDEELPLSAENAILQLLMEEGGKQLDSHIWQAVYQPSVISTVKSSGWAGITDRKIFFNGFLPKMINDAYVPKVSSPVTLTKSNILGELERIKVLVPEAIKENQNLKYLMNATTAEIYDNALKALPNKGLEYTAAGVRLYNGKPIVIISGIPDNTIVVGVFSDGMDSNLWLGVNEPDEQDYILMDKWNAAGEHWFMKSLFKIDVNYGIPSQMVLYTTWTLPADVTFTDYNSTP